MSGHWEGACPLSSMVLVPRVLLEMFEGMLGGVCKQLAERSRSEPHSDSGSPAPLPQSTGLSPMSPGASAPTTMSNISTPLSTAEKATLENLVTLPALLPSLALPARPLFVSSPCRSSAPASQVIFSQQLLRPSLAKPVGSLPQAQFRQSWSEASVVASSSSSTLAAQCGLTVLSAGKWFPSSGPPIAVSPIQHYASHRRVIAL